MVSFPAAGDGDRFFLTREVFILRVSANFLLGVFFVIFGVFVLFGGVFVFCVCVCFFFFSRVSVKFFFGSFSAGS